MSIAEQLTKLPPCPRPCSVCHPGHHWYLKFGDEDCEEVNAVCKHCDATLTDIDVSDPLCPEF